ncbi:ABC transporter substrate-binding protein [Bacillus cereus]|nr:MULTISPECIES: ABC transporter substrate-binding protein [Bacillus cereus group]MBL3741154.1 ABC transporter substrate-binding protein [Bacillus cereus]MBL3863820.1 ABC transporter substrate-binding protein [Bacillus cereus]
MVWDMYRDINAIKLLLKGESEFRFNPLLWRTEADLWIMGCMYQGIMMFDENLEISDRLTKKVDLINDSMECTLELKEDLYWSDGTPISTYDIEFTIKVLLNPSFKGNRGNHLLNIMGALEYKEGIKKDIEGIEILNDRNIKFQFIKPDESFKRRLLLPIIPKHIFEKYSVNEFLHKVIDEECVSCGPYKLKSFTKNNFKFQKNDTFHLGVPRIPNMEIELNNTDHFLKKLYTNEVDFSILSYDEAYNFEHNQEQSDYTIYKLPKPQINFIALNHRNKYLKVKEFRKAIMHGINRNEILNVVYKNYGNIINQYYPSLLEQYVSNDLQNYDYNVKKALNEIDKLQESNNISLKMGIPSEDKESLLTAQIIKRNLIEIGITLEIIECSKSTWRQKFKNEQLDMYIMNYLLFLDPDPQMLFGKNSHFISAIGWENATNVSLIDMGQQDKQKRVSIYKEWSKLINTQLPILPLLSPYDIQVIHNRIKGIKPDPRGVLWNIHELEIKGV